MAKHRTCSKKAATRARTGVARATDRTHGQAMDRGKHPARSPRAIAAQPAGAANGPPTRGPARRPPVGR
eukprot:6956402-Alexandrium_andersonii.AAC.1